MAKLILRVPDDWKTLTEQVQRAAGSPAILAGGALRDLYNGKPVKDLDIFVSAYVPSGDEEQNGDFHIKSEVSTFDAIDAHMKELGFLRDNIMPGSVLPDETDLERSIIYKHHREGVLDVNVCLLRIPVSLKSVVERIDFGLCQIGCDCEGRTYATPAFFKDAFGEKFTLLRAAGKERSLARYDRLKDKYVGWPLIDLSNAEAAPC
jgi:hypothetical protein